MVAFLSEEQKLIQGMVRDFALREIEPIASILDKEHRFPEEIMPKLAELNLFGIPFPEEVDGAGSDFLSFALVVEELSRVCASTGVIISTHTALCSWPIYEYGTEEQKNKYLSRLNTGNYLGAFALTEPGAGTDAAAINTNAVLKGEEWVINGSKIFITNGGNADIYIVIAMTQPDLGTKGLSAFIVEKGTKGFSIGEKEKKLGIKASSTTPLYFADCIVPKEALLGKEGQGLEIALNALDLGRIGIASQAIGIAQSAFDASIKYAKERVQFGKPISRLQAIQWMIADMGTEIEAARLLTYQAALAKDSGLPIRREAAMAKLFASETSSKVATKAIQIHGGYGYTENYPVERAFRDARITEIYEGTSEAQRMVIAGSYLR
jgi:butyryl-CoA dehydrogenase